MTIMDEFSEIENLNEQLGESLRSVGEVELPEYAVLERKIQEGEMAKAELHQLRKDCAHEPFEGDYDEGDSVYCELCGMDMTEYLEDRARWAEEDYAELASDSERGL